MMRVTLVKSVYGIFLRRPMLGEAMAGKVEGWEDGTVRVLSCPDPSCPGATPQP